MLSQDQRVRVIAALVEGNSVRSTERLVGVHRDTILKLLVRVGDGCAALQDRLVRGLRCASIELDEIWAFVNKRRKKRKPPPPFQSSAWVIPPKSVPLTTLVSRGAQCVIACPPSSIPIQRRPILCATAAVVPEPRK